MSPWIVRTLVFAGAFLLFVPVRWHVWGGRLRNHRWRFAAATFGQMVDAEKRHVLIALGAWALVIGALTWWATT